MERKTHGRVGGSLRGVEGHSERKIFFSLVEIFSFPKIISVPKIKINKKSHHNFMY